MNKKAQTIFGISFGMFFSIIVIIFIISVAVYAITYFLNINECSQIGLFYEGFQNEIDKAWTSDIYQGDFSGEISLPSGIENVCFGLLSQDALLIADDTIKDVVQKDYSGSGEANIFFYPPEKSCDGSLASNILYHVKTDNFFCTEVVKGKITIKLENQPTFEKVKLSK